jgi:hypothetical protein
MNPFHAWTRGLDPTSTGRHSDRNLNGNTAGSGPGTAARPTVTPGPGDSADVHILACRVRKIPHPNRWPGRAIILDLETGDVVAASTCVLQRRDVDN